MHRFLCICSVVTIVSWAEASGPAVAAPAETPIGGVFPLEQVQAGQVGYGLSVFSGSVPERFEVEILGVLEKIQPDTSYILARLSGRVLEESGVIAGMSGSPVFVEGRLLGAVSFGWPFSLEAIAGITPAQDMRDLIGVSVPEREQAGSIAVDLGSIVRAETPPGRLVEALARLRPVRVGEGTAALEWLLSGFGDTSRHFLTQGMGAVMAAGAASGSSPDLAPGAAVSAVLIDGDLRLAASGTVTDRQGDTVLAFGHPLLGLGSQKIPMAGADVVTVVSSQVSSFKVTNLAEVVGAFDFDHAAGVRGEVGLEAPVIPVRMRLVGPGQRSLELRVADVPQLTPTLVATAVLGALDTATEAVGTKGIDLVADFDLGSIGKLQLTQSFDGADAVLQTALHLLAVGGYLLQNELQEVEIASIDLELTRYLEPRTLRLVGAHAARTVVRPGDRVPLNLDLVEYRGGSVRKSLDVDLPTSIPDGRYSLLIGDGVSIDATRLAIERFEPVNFGQALEFLNSLHSRRQLVVLGIFEGPGLAVAGEALPRLPASVRSLWGAAASGSAVPLRLAIGQENGIHLTEPVEGILRIDLEVERREPWTGTLRKRSRGEAESTGSAPEGGVKGQTALDKTARSGDEPQ
jgi:hypothetical protein